MSKRDPFIDDPGASDDERQLQALFDATAEEAPREAINRLARHAAQVPDRAVSPLAAWLRRVAPALALAAAATAGWFLFADAGGDDPSPSPTVATTATPPSATAPDDGPAPEDGPAPDAPAPSSEEPDELWLAVIDGNATDLDEDLGGELDDPMASLGMETVDAHPMSALAALFPPEDDAEALEIYTAALDAALAEDS